MNPLTIFKFLTSNYNSLPASVRVLVYLVLLFVFVFLALKPRYIHGDIRWVDKEDGKAGGFLPHSLAKVESTFEGRTVTVSTDSHGVWAMPLIPKAPQEILLKISNKNEIRYFEIKVSAVDAWLGAETRIVYDPEEEAFEIATSGGFREAVARRLGAIWRAVAGVFQAGEAHAQDDWSRTREKLIGIISKRFKIDPELIELDAHLQETLNLGLKQQIILKASIEREFGIAISAEEWSNSLFIEKMINLILLTKGNKKKLN